MDAHAVQCLSCKEIVGCVFGEDRILMSHGLTPGDHYPDPQDTGRHHRAQLNWITPEDMTTLTRWVHDRVLFRDTPDSPGFLFHIPERPPFKMWWMLRNWFGRDRLSDFTKIPAA